jgi:hypothetical protein
MVGIGDPELMNVASHTLELLRRIDGRLDQIGETLLRHDTRLGRIERDVNEVKSDVVLLENRALNQVNEAYSLKGEVQTIHAKLDALLSRLGTLEQAMQRLDGGRGSR